MPGMIKKLGTFSATISNGATLVLTPPFEVVDWKHVEIQVDTITITSGLSPADVAFELSTALDKDEYPFYVALEDQFDVAVAEGESGYGTWTAGLRGWAVVRVVNNTGSPVRLSLRVTVLYKERTT